MEYPRFSWEIGEDSLWCQGLIKPRWMATAMA